MREAANNDAEFLSFLLCRFWLFFKFQNSQNVHTLFQVNFRMSPYNIEDESCASGGAQRRADESPFGARASRQVRRWRT